MLQKLTYARVPATVRLHLATAILILELEQFSSTIALSSSSS